MRWLHWLRRKWLPCCLQADKAVDWEFSLQGCKTGGFGGNIGSLIFHWVTCINSGETRCGVLTQYQPLRLNTHIGIRIPWDLDRNIGGVTILPPYEKSANSEWYTGTANAIYQNLDYMETYNPDYVLILSGDHIYKMDYEVMLDFQGKSCSGCYDCSDAGADGRGKQIGIVVTDEESKIKEFEEKPRSQAVIWHPWEFIFSW